MCRTPVDGKGISATTPQSTQLLDEAFEVIGSASKDLMVASFGWDADHVLTRHLVERARDGLNVTVLARMRPKSMSALKELAEAGAQVLGFPWLHAKAILGRHRQRARDVSESGAAWARRRIRTGCSP